MGKYFLMSKKFDKNTAEDFGLISKADGIAIKIEDDSQWKKVNLYDFGWGKENGFCKLPPPTFDELFDLCLYSDDEEDKYGAAALILDSFPAQLLDKCETALSNPENGQLQYDLIVLFNLKNPVNRCPIIGKTTEEIAGDAARWDAVSVDARRIMECHR